MCRPGQPSAAPGPVPATATEAAATARSALAWLADADAAALTTSEQAECLRLLEQAESAHTAARASVLAAFRASDGCRDDGHSQPRPGCGGRPRSPTAPRPARSGRCGAWPPIPSSAAPWPTGRSPRPGRARSARGPISSPPRCAMTPNSFLLHAARGGAELEDLGGMAEEIQRQTARPDTDGPDDGFDDRSVSLETTFGGAGTLRGNLAPSCAAAVSAVLESLGKRVGPEDLRSRWQRQHDALEEACRLLAASNCLPDRACAAHANRAARRSRPAARDARRCRRRGHVPRPDRAAGSRM